MAQHLKKAAKNQTQHSNENPEDQLLKYEDHVVSTATDDEPTPYPLWVRLIVIGMLLILLFGVIAGAFYMFF